GRMRRPGRSDPADADSRTRRWLHLVRAGAARLPRAPAGPRPSHLDLRGPAAQGGGGGHRSAARRGWRTAPARLPPVVQHLPRRQRLEHVLALAHGVPAAAPGGVRPPDPAPPARAAGLTMRSFLVAVAFLTVVPIRFRTLPPPRTVARSRFWYPVVGLLLGTILGGWTALLTAWGRAPLFGAVLVLGAWVGLTGALHLDGFCDLCDGLVAGRTAEDRLRIMKDPHLGSFALAGGVLLLLAKFALLHEIMTTQPGRGPWLVGGAVVLARCLALCLAAGARYPRPEGTGKALIEAPGGREAILFAVLAGGAALLAVPPTAAWLAAVLLGAGLLVVGLLRWLCGRQLGGVTGDCLGACIELVEAVVLAGA